MVHVTIFSNVQNHCKTCTSGGADNDVQAEVAVTCTN